MKLYLCSYRIQLPEALARLVGKPLKGTTVAVIPNAKDYYADRARAYKIKEMHAYLREHGLQPETVDLRDYTDGQALLAKLKMFDMLWVAGGNTFCLREAMRSSGFEDIVHELLENVVYAGESAGALVAGTSLKGIEPADIPEFAGMIIEDGLRIVPKFILPHAGSVYFAEANETALAVHSGEEIIEIADNQAYVIDGDRTELLTAPIAPEA